ncbi:hypothetical protein [Motiliproteus sediminis]|uniref:hypothetical protein n=1 Tax=Motiliproteus sediminis TaxID=1468178 RepID=UPI001AEFC2A7|nr:hypothetical protein [Motiliproteus sediminis]
MVRDDDIGEVPNLGPARDELDEPRVKPKPAAKPKPIPEAPKAPRPPSAPRASGHGHGFIYLMLLLVIVAATGFGFWSQQRATLLQSQLLGMQQQQQIADGKIAALEALISTTDENASKSGAALQAQVKKILQQQEGRIAHVDSEIAKLWTVAHQRNRPKIEELEKSVAGIDKQLASVDKRVGAVATQVEQSGKVLASTGKQLNELTVAQAQQQDARRQQSEQLRLRDQANQELDELQDAQLKQLSEQLAALKKNPQLPAKAAAQLEEQGRSIESINAFRKQINQEVLRLRERINDVQLQIPNKPAS